MDVLEISEFGLEKIGTWMYGIENLADRLKINRQPTTPKRMLDDDNTLRNKTLTIVTAISKPYTMLREEAEQLTGNDRYEGFAIDLIFELSLLLEFNYIFIEEPHYGKCIDKQANIWDGMIGKVMSGVSVFLCVQIISKKDTHYFNCCTRYRWPILQSLI